MASKYCKTAQLPHGRRRCVETIVEREEKPALIARFGGIPLKRDPYATIKDQSLFTAYPPRNEILKRLLADVCEICGATGNIDVHHIHALKDLHKKGRRAKPLWMQQMAARRRKTLMVCKPCHDDIHAGRPIQRATPV